jgi:choline dehydrogenase-like flavoprotein
MVMPDATFQVMARAEPYDAIVVGSGATGGVAAWRLARAGLRVLVMEAGPEFAGGRAHGSTLGNLARQLYRHHVVGRQRVQERHGGYWEVNPDLFLDDVDHPYVTPEDRPYRWVRSRLLGGRSLTWGGVTLRLSDFEFKAASRDGIGADWPIGHDDLAPYYDEIERFLNVHGSKEGLAALPDGAFREPRPMTPGEHRLAEAAARGGKGDGDGRVIISRGIRAGRHPDKGARYSRLSSPGTTLAAAIATGRATVRAGAVVTRLIVTQGRATAVEYLDAETKTYHEARARVVFLCASTIESLRILMSSRSDEHPEGLGASSGVLGRYLMDHIVGNVMFTLPDVPDRGGLDLTGADSIVVPRYRNLGATREPYARGFGLWGGVQRLPVPDLLRKQKGVAFGFLCAMGEALPDADNRMELDATATDVFGLPVPRISCAWTANDLAVHAAAVAEASELVESAGGVVQDFLDLAHTPFLTRFMKSFQEEWRRTTPGLFVHEVGGARMGVSPRDSVVDPSCRCWDAPNVFVTDGACWVSSGWQNPTLTEMAITARACAHAVDDLARHDR